jgi:hypothetical protein
MLAVFLFFVLQIKHWTLPLRWCIASHPWRPFE